MKDSIRESVNHVLSGVFVQNLINKVSVMSASALDNTHEPGIITAKLSRNWLNAVKNKGGIPQPHEVRYISDEFTRDARLREHCEAHILRNGCVGRPQPRMECPTLAANRRAHLGYRLVNVITE
jgi:hypothetical protein